jgi:type III secretion protein J
MMLAAALLAGCAVPVAGGLDERDANQVAVALSQAGIEAAKELDPSSEGHYRIMVSRDDAPSAIAAMREHDLPPRHAPGVLESLGKGSLVPSPLAEHAQYVAAVAGDIERTLASIDGVLGARVHLSIPHASPLSDKPVEKPTASVLVKHAGSTPPIAELEVRRLVSGAVSNLAPDSVTVVMLSRPAAVLVPDRQLAHFGPITVTRSSAGWLRAHLGISFAFLLALLGVVLFLWSRLRRLPQPPVAGEGL